MAENITIQPEAVEAAARALAEYNCENFEGDFEYFSEEARYAILAALNAWPGMLTTEAYSQELNRPCLILPLPQQENSDE